MEQGKDFLNKSRKHFWLVVPGVVVLALGAFWWFSPLRRHWQAGAFQYLPADNTFAAHVDLAGLRGSPILQKLLLSQATPPPASDYGQFVSATGFNYEQDLDSLSVGMSGSEANRVVNAVLEGRFHREKLDNYLQAHRKSNNVFMGVNVDEFQSQQGRAFRLAFLGSGRLLFSNAPDARPIQDMIRLSRRDGESLADRLRALDVFDRLPKGAQAWASIDVEHGAHLALPTSPGSGLSFTSDLLRGSRVTLASARLGDRQVDFQLTAVYGSEADARRVAESLKGLRALLAALSVRNGRAKGGVELAEALNRINVSSDKNAAVVQMTAGEALLQKLFADAQGSTPSR